ncbi:hypothetical protein AJ78_03348 [Emergomyces pasteurianus Ep9510]|uniref:Uncharacterized protein n=1 Tax=Emergomyces pasteurianus Ep9510 TaxID=1447872 RepID=A0A1J9QMP3_9EURO|nr:hypothetical protein AJ78_03348 [Emergomyces pasteurianus Ep9510]
MSRPEGTYRPSVSRLLKLVSQLDISKYYIDTEYILLDSKNTLPPQCNPKPKSNFKINHPQDDAVNSSRKSFPNRHQPADGPVTKKEEIVEFLNIPESTAEEFLELADRKNLKLSYNPHTKKIKTLMRRWIQSSCVNWVQDWVMNLRRLEQWDWGTISAAGEGELRLFAGEYANGITMPDCAVFISALDYPVITMEVAYTETYENLKKGARLLLEGTAGEISIAIPVKIVPLKPDETRVQSAFVQIYEYDSLWNEAIPRGGCKTLFPVPQNHARQKIEFSWRDILKTQLSQLQPVLEKPPPLFLDDLRKIINAYTDKHIRLRTRYANLSG